MGLLDTTLATVSNKKPRNADRILPSEELNLRGLLDVATNVPVVGDALSGGLALYDAAKGDYGSAALNAVSVLPFLSVGMIKKAGKVADAVNTPKLTDFEQRHLIAQRNAALPVEQGGLGLPVDNTAMDRARAMGFDEPAVHFSRHGIDVNELDSGKFAIAPFDAVGTHFGSESAALERFNNTVGYKVNNPSYANDELKGVTYPVFIKKGNQMLDESGNVLNELPISTRFSEKADYGNLRDSNAKLRAEVFGKYDSIPYVNDVESAGSVSYIVPPRNIRSRFAAFDPMRRHEADLLGYADPRLLGAIAGGGLLGLGGYSLLDQ